MADSAQDDEQVVAPDSNEDESAPNSPAPEDTSLGNSPRSDGGSFYEDAPSRLDESQLEQNANCSPEKSTAKANVFDENNTSLASNESEDNSHKQPSSPGEVLSPQNPNDTIYASASESFLSEAGEQEASRKENDSASEDMSEGIVDDTEETNDPLGLDDEDSNIDGLNDKEEGEEGELDGEEETNELTNTSAYQTEPVSSDDDLDAVQDNDNQNRFSKRTDNLSGSRIESERTGGKNRESAQNGHGGTDNDLNHEDHVELDYEEDLDEGDNKLRDSKIDDEEKVQ